jgi:hypothetical protein
MYYTDQLLSEIADGQGQKLRALTKLVPDFRKNKPSTVSRLFRWALQGVAGPDGQRILLECVKTPGGLISTPAAISRFFVAQTPNETTATEPTPSGKRTKAQRQRAAERAARMLERALNGNRIQGTAHPTPAPPTPTTPRTTPTAEGGAGMSAAHGTPTPSETARAGEAQDTNGVHITGLPSGKSSSAARSTSFPS